MHDGIAGGLDLEVIRSLYMTAQGLQQFRQHLDQHGNVAIELVVPIPAIRPTLLAALLLCSKALLCLTIQAIPPFV